MILRSWIQIRGCQTNLLATLGKYQNPRWHAQHENNLWTEISLALSIFYNILHYTKLHDAPLLIRNWLHIMRTGQFPTRLFLYYMINDYYKSICSATDYRYAYKSQSIVQLTLCWTGGFRSPPWFFPDNFLSPAKFFFSLLGILRQYRPAHIGENRFQKSFAVPQKKIFSREVNLWKPRMFNSQSTDILHQTYLSFRDT